MKNILNKIGAVSKPVIFGAALGVATVAVGVGIATNFMSDGPKGVSGRVLGQYSGDTASVGSGGGYDAYSREALEQQMAAARAQREGGTALDYLGSMGKDKFAYGSKGNAYEGGTVDPMAMNNATYEGEAGLSTGPDMSGAMDQFNQTASAAIANAGANAGVAGAEGTEKAQLEKAGASGTALNKLNATSRIGSGGGSASGKGGSAGSRNMGAIQGATSDKPGQQNVAAVNMGDGAKGDIAGIAGAKHGRLGSMGGSNAKGGSGGNSGSGQAFAGNSANQLLHVSRNLSNAKKTVYSDAEKGFMDAEIAWQDAAEASDGVQIDGNAPMIEKAASLEREANKINNKNNIKKPFQDLEQSQEDYKKLNKKFNGVVMLMLGTLIGALYAMSAFSGWALWVRAIVMAIGIAAVWVESIGLFNISNQISRLGFGFGDNNFQSTMAWVLPTVATAMLGMSMATPILVLVKKFVTMKMMIIGALVGAFGALKAFIGF